MNPAIRTAALLFSAAILPSAANAANYAIDWLDMSPVPVSNSIPNSQVFNLPGYGNVKVTYSSAAPINWVRNDSPPAQNGSVVFGGDTYAWTSVSHMAGVNGPDGTPAQDYIITFALLNGPLVNSQLVLSAFGLGHSTTPGFTRVNVNTDGTFLGDWDLGANFGPTSFLGGVGSFNLQSTLTEPTNGFFNTDFGLIELDQNPLSFDLAVHHIDEDGIGFTIGRYTPVPEPAGAALFAAAAGLTILRRRRP